jgi:RNase P/RNase MRP subunit p29
MYAIKNRLVLLLVLQVLVCAAVFGWQMRAASTDNSSRPLLGDFVDTVTELTLAEKDKTLVLKKNGAHWEMQPNGETLKVDGNRISQLLADLKAIKASWPVATTADAAERFELSDNHFQRRLLLKGSTGEKTVYLGTTPSFRKVHLRMSGEDNIFAVALAVNDVSANASDWLDKNQLAVEGNISNVKTAAWQLQKNQDAWTQLNAGDGSTMPTPDAAKVSIWLGNWQNLQVSSLVQDETAYHDLAATATVSLLANDKETVFRYFDKDGKHVVRRDQQKTLFEISEATARELFAKDAATLTATAPAPDAASAGTALPSAAAPASPPAVTAPQP